MSTAGIASDSARSRRKLARALEARCEAPELAWRDHPVDETRRPVDEDRRVDALPIAHGEGVDVDGRALAGSEPDPLRPRAGRDAEPRSTQALVAGDVDLKVGMRSEPGVHRIRRRSFSGRECRARKPVHGLVLVSARRLVLRQPWIPPEALERGHRARRPETRPEPPRFVAVERSRSGRHLAESP